MTNGDHRGEGAPPRSVDVGEADKKKTNWLAWLLLLLGVLALVFALLRRDREEEPVNSVLNETRAESARASL